VLSSALQSAIHAGTPALTGVGALLARFVSLTKTQAVALCLSIAVAPLVWKQMDNRALAGETARVRIKLDTVRLQQEQVSAEIELLRNESAKLDLSLAESTRLRARNEEAGPALQALRARVRRLLADPSDRWPEDSRYVRISKSVIKDLDLQAMFSRLGVLSEQAQEILAITPQEKSQAEHALGDYWRGVEDLMASSAYETNAAIVEAGRVAKTVVVPPLGEAVKALAADAQARLTDTLGAEREKILFGGWDEGAIQLFWPGNLWKIAEESQTITVWVEPAQDNSREPRYGSSRTSKIGGTSGTGIGDVPQAIVTRSFEPWLQQLGITNPSSLLHK